MSYLPQDHTMPVLDRSNETKVAAAPKSVQVNKDSSERSQLKTISSVYANLEKTDEELQFMNKSLFEYINSMIDTQKNIMKEDTSKDLVTESLVSQLPEIDNIGVKTAGKHESGQLFRPFAENILPEVGPSIELSNSIGCGSQQMNSNLITLVNSEKNEEIYKEFECTLRGLGINIKRPDRSGELKQFSTVSHENNATPYQNLHESKDGNERKDSLIPESSENYGQGTSEVDYYSDHYVDAYDTGYLADDDNAYDNDPNERSSCDIASSNLIYLHNPDSVKVPSDSGPYKIIHQEQYYQNYMMKSREAEEEKLKFLTFASDFTKQLNKNRHSDNIGGDKGDLESWIKPEVVVANELQAQPSLRKRKAEDVEDSICQNILKRYDEYKKNIASEIPNLKLSSKTSQGNSPLEEDLSTQPQLCSDGKATRAGLTYGEYKKRRLKTLLSKDATNETNVNICTETSGITVDPVNSNLTELAKLEGKELLDDPKCQDIETSAQLSDNNNPSANINKSSDRVINTKETGRYLDRNITDRTNRNKPEFDISRSKDVRPSIDPRAKSRLEPKEDDFSKNSNTITNMKFDKTYGRWSASSSRYGRKTIESKKDDKGEISTNPFSPFNPNVKNKKPLIETKTKERPSPSLTEIFRLHEKTKEKASTERKDKIDQRRKLYTPDNQPEKQKISKAPTKIKDKVCEPLVSSTRDIEESDKQISKAIRNVDKHTLKKAKAGTIKEALPTPSVSSSLYQCDETIKTTSNNNVNDKLVLEIQNPDIDSSQQCQDNIKETNTTTDNSELNVKRKETGNEENVGSGQIKREDEACSSNTCKSIIDTDAQETLEVQEVDETSKDVQNTDIVVSEDNLADISSAQTENNETSKDVQNTDIVVTEDNLADISSAQTENNETTKIEAQDIMNTGELALQTNVKFDAIISNSEESKNEINKNENLDEPNQFKSEVAYSNEDTSENLGKNIQVKTEIEYAEEDTTKNLDEKLQFKSEVGYSEEKKDKDDLYSRQMTSEYNDLILTCKTKSCKVKLIDIFWKAKSEGKFKKSKLNHLVRKFMKKYNSKIKMVNKLLSQNLLSSKKSKLKSSDAKSNTLIDHQTITDDKLILEEKSNNSQKTFSDNQANVDTNLDNVTSISSEETVTKEITDTLLSHENNPQIISDSINKSINKTSIFEKETENKNLEKKLISSKSINVKDYTSSKKHIKSKLKKDKFTKLNEESTSCSIKPLINEEINISSVVDNNDSMACEKNISLEINLQKNLKDNPSNIKGKTKKKSSSVIIPQSLSSQNKFDNMVLACKEHVCKIVLHDIFWKAKLDGKFSEETLNNLVQSFMKEYNAKSKVGEKLIDQYESNEKKTKKQIKKGKAAKSIKVIKQIPNKNIKGETIETNSIESQQNLHQDDLENKPNKKRKANRSSKKSSKSQSRKCSLPYIDKENTDDDSDAKDSDTIKKRKLCEIDTRDTGESAVDFDKNNKCMLMIASNDKTNEDNASRKVVYNFLYDFDKDLKFDVDRLNLGQTSAEDSNDSSFPHPGPLPVIEDCSLPVIESESLQEIDKMPHSFLDDSDSASEDVPFIANLDSFLTDLSKIATNSTVNSVRKDKPTEKSDCNLLSFSKNCADNLDKPILDNSASGSSDNSPNKSTHISKVRTKAELKENVIKVEPINQEEVEEQTQKDCETSSENDEKSQTECEDDTFEKFDVISKHKNQEEVEEQTLKDCGTSSENDEKSQTECEDDTFKKFDVLSEPSSSYLLTEESEVGSLFTCIHCSEQYSSNKDDCNETIKYSKNMSSFCINCFSEIYKEEYCSPKKELISGREKYEKLQENLDDEIAS